MREVAILLCLFLAGCGVQRMGGYGPVPASQPASPAIGPIAGPGIEEVRADVRTSSNATQQAITGLGANIGKVGESITGFGGDLARVSASMETQIKATADLRAELSANATAQVGLRNDIQQLAIASRAGRDSTVSTVQFNKEMRDSLVAAYDVNKYTVWVMCGMVLGIVTAFLESSRRRADARAKEHLAELRLARGKNP